MLYPLLFHDNFFELVWGGHRLRPFKGLAPNDQKLGESWEISAIPGKESIVSNGAFAGKSLLELVDLYGERILGKKVVQKYGNKFPLLIKFIDAESDLSIQVHPDNELAQIRHNCLGKTEMWFVIDAKPNACLYSGFKQRLTKEEYAAMVEDGTITDALAKHPVRTGDVFFIPAGRVHAICGGTLIAEVQQSSDITYRIYDYNRPGLDGKPRELHTELAKNALDYTVHDKYTSDYHFEVNRPLVISECPYFTVKVHHINKTIVRKLLRVDSFIVYMCLHGSCTIEMLADSNSPVKDITLTQGHSVLIPAVCAHTKITPSGDDGVTELLEVFIDNVNF